VELKRLIYWPELKKILGKPYIGFSTMKKQNIGSIPEWQISYEFSKINFQIYL